MIKKPGGQPQRDLTGSIDLAEQLIHDGQVDEALELLHEFLPRHDGNAQLHLALGHAHHEAGDAWQALAHRHRAQKLLPTPEAWLPLLAGYLRLGLSALALDASRRAAEDEVILKLEDLDGALAMAELRVRTVAAAMGLRLDQAEAGLRFFEDGQIALHTQDYSRCISLNRRAQQILGRFPPCLNNTSLAQFFSGSPQAAIRSAERVLADDPENIHALANMIRFLSWTGRQDEARMVWRVLKALDPVDHQTRMKLVEAAAMMKEDERVRNLLIDIQPDEDEDDQHGLRRELLLAVSEANLGLVSAVDRLRRLSGAIPFAGLLLEAYERGQPGPGWAERYPYFHSSELVPSGQLDAFLDLLQRATMIPPKRVKAQVRRFVSRYPQLVLFAEKLILEDSEPEAGISLLEALATPEAYRTLQHFGLGQVGSEEARMQALFALQRAGVIQNDDVISLWREDEWREIRLRSYEIGGRRDLPYTEKVNRMLEQATEANLRGDEETAVELYEEVLRREPRAKEAYNNLASIYARWSEHELAQGFFERALDIDPNYVISRCNLATYLMGDGKLDEAEALILPSFERVRLHKQEYAFLCVTRARLLMLQAQGDQARKLLKMALDVDPQYRPALDLLDDLDWEAQRLIHRAKVRRKQAERERRKRRRLQAAIKSDAPTLAAALGVLTKDQLTEVGRAVGLAPGRTALNKEELIRATADRVSSPASLDPLIRSLSQLEKEALTSVLEKGGVMDWDEFDGAYGNDLDESPSWRFNPPTSPMGRLRSRGLIAEATVAGRLLIVIPLELRSVLPGLLARAQTEP